MSKTCTNQYGICNEYKTNLIYLCFNLAEKETDYEKQLKEEEKILDSIAEKKGLFYSQGSIM